MGILRTDRVAGLGGANAIKGSVSFNNNLGDYLNGFLKVNLDSSNRSNFLFDGDFTIECWVFKSKSTVSGDYDGLLYISSDWRFKWQQSDKIMYYDNGTDAQFMNYNTNEGFLDNNWHHLAIVRSSNTITGYVDGTSYGTASESGNFDPGSNTELLIGYNVHGFGGFISNLRVVKGTAVYTGNFTPPTSELTEIDGTVLLCCQSPGNVIQEATGNYIVESVVHPNATLNSKPPSSSHFTPNSPVGFSTTSDVGSQYGSTFDGVTIFDSQAYMVVPGGNTRERNRGRGIYTLGYSGTPAAGNNDRIDYINIQSQGNTVRFGSLSANRYSLGAGANSTRCLFTGGYVEGNSPDTDVNIIEFVTIASEGNATDFGDRIQVGRVPAVASNDTRCVMASAKTGSGNQNTIDKVEFATTGDATNFGDLSSKRTAMCMSCNSTTRGIFSGGYQPSPVSAAINTMEFITFASISDTTNFGDLTSAARNSTGGTASSSTRGLIGLGFVSPARVNTIDFVTIASQGDAVDFGDLTLVRNNYGSLSNSTRGVFLGGNDPYTNTIDFVTIATTGDASDFGDVSVTQSGLGAAGSDSHGGLS